MLKMYRTNVSQKNEETRVEVVVTVWYSSVVFHFVGFVIV